jgi:hypothetical protein
MYIQKAVLQIRIRDRVFFRLPDTVSRSGMAKNPEPGSRNRDEHPRSVFWFKNSVADPDPRLFSSRPNWDSPTPSPAAMCSLPLWFRGDIRYPHCGRGGGGSQFRRGDRHCGTLGTSLGIYAHCVHRHGGGTLYTDNMHILYVWEAA